MELTVLGCSGSYGAPAGGACSGYLVRAGRHVDLDGLRQRHVREPAAAHRSRRPRPRSCITHGHPDHCVDIYGLHVLYRVRPRAATGLPVYAPEGVERAARSARRRLGRHVRLARGRRRRHAHDRRRRPAVLAHRPPAAHVRGRDRRRRQAARLHRRHRPRLERRARSRPAPTSCCRRRRTSTTTSARRSTSRRARPARRRARRRRARLMLTHFWPTLDPVASVEEGSEAFGARGHARGAAPRHRRSDAGRSPHAEPRGDRMGIRRDGREPDDLRPLTFTRDFTEMAAGLGARRVRPHPRAVHRVGRGARPAVAEGQGQGLGHRRVLDAAGLDARARRPRSGEGQAERAARRRSSA